MAINSKTATILGGAAFGAYTSDITDDPLSGILSTAIGAATGSFMKVPSFSIKEMSKVNVGPTVDLGDVFTRQAPLEVNLSQTREKLLSAFNKELNSIQKQTKRYDAKLANLKSRYDSKVEARFNAFKSEYEAKVNSFTSSYDSRISHLESLVPLQQGKFNKQIESAKANRSRLGIKDSKGLIIESFRTDNEVSRSLDKWVQLKKDPSYEIKARKQATERINTNKDSYLKEATYRRDQKLIKSSDTMANIRGLMDDFGLSYSDNGRIKLSGNFRNSAISEAERYSLVEEYNKAQHLNAKISLDPISAIDYEMKNMHKNITEGFVRYNAMPDFINNLDAGFLNKNKLTRSELEGLSKSRKLRDAIVDKYSGMQSFNVANLQEEISNLKDPQARQAAIDQFKQSLGLGPNTVASKYHEDHYNKIRDSIIKDRDERLSSYTGNSKIKEYLRTKGITVNTDAELKAFLETTTNSEILGNLDRLSKGSLFDINAVKANKLDTYSASIKAGKDQVEKLTEHFRDQLGNSPEMAREKAEMFVEKAKGDIFVSDGSLSFTDKSSKKSVTVPLTSYSDGMRFHYAGGGNYQTVSQFNPYGAYLGNNEKKTMIDGVLRPVTAQDLLKGQDPEMMLKYLPEGSEINSVVPHIRSLFHYDSSESGTGASSLGQDFKPKASQAFVNSQGVINLGFTLQENEFNEIDINNPFKKLNVMSNNGEISERSKMINHLTKELGIDAAHLFDGLSLNSLTEIQTKGFDSIAMLAPNERNETGVGNRGYELYQRYAETNLLADLYGEERFNRQFSTSQAIQKLDITDHKLFNEITASLYGNDKVLADGAGFFKMGSDRFSVKDRAILKIPLEEVAINNPDLLKAIQSENLTEYLANNPIVIGNESLASTGTHDIALNKMYTSGTITNGYMTDKDLRLQVDAVFDANQEGNVKLFSTGTKSLNTGLDDDMFKEAAGIGELINNGSLTKRGNKFYINGNETSLQDIQNLARQSGTAGAVQMIGRADDTGMDKVIANMESGMKGNKVFDHLMSNGKNKESSALLAMMFSEHKASVDLMATMAASYKQRSNTLFRSAFRAFDNPDSKIDINEIHKNLVSSGFMRSSNLPLTRDVFEAAQRESDSAFTRTFNTKNFLVSNDKLGHIEEAYSMLERSKITSNIKQGRGLAIGSFNKGMSIVGAGNRARMSWTAVANLKASGMTEEQLSLFGNRNKDLLYEVRSTVAEHSRSSNSINSKILGKEGQFFSIINAQIAPEKRAEMFEKFYGRSDLLENSAFLSYNLTDDSHAIKSINFSRITTNRSGFYEKSDGVHLLKDLEKKKIALMTADLKFRDATNAEARAKAKSELDVVMKDYMSYTRSMYKSSNNLLKESLALESTHSDIMQVKGIGGTAEAYADSAMKQGRNVWFISEGEALHKAKQIGKTLEWEDLGNGLKRGAYKGEDGALIPLASILTREPAQGPMSSDLVEWIVDTSLKSNTRSNAYVSNNSLFYTKGMFGDMDQDTVHTLLGDFKNQGQFNEIQGQRTNVRKTFLEMEGVLESIKVKGAKNVALKSLTDFESEEEYASHRSGSAVKGRVRKTTSAPATGLAVAYSKALELELGGDLTKESRLIKGRMMSHQLVENLIKSAHMDTSKFENVQIQSVEALTDARKRYIGKGKNQLTSKEYEQILRTELPTFLNIHNIDKNSANYASATAIMEDLISSELNHSVKVGNKPFNPMDLAEHRNKTGFSDALVNILKDSGVEMDYESGFNHKRTSSGQIVTGMSDVVKDFVKTNKGVIAGGFAAMAGVALLGRDSPSFSDSRDNIKQHNSKMLRAPTGSFDGDTMNNSPMGINTNTVKSNYMIPKSFDSRNVKVDGDFIEDSINTYNDFTSLVEPENIQEQAHNMASAMFGDGIRSARLQTN